MISPATINAIAWGFMACAVLFGVLWIAGVRRAVRKSLGRLIVGVMAVAGRSKQVKIRI